MNQCPECSRLASRVEELEKLIAKHSGSLNTADSASNATSSSTAKEIREKQVVSPASLRLCITHGSNVRDTCLSCKFALDWNLYHKYCIECGEVATGYRTLSADSQVEFFCDDHFKGIEFPAKQGSKEAASGVNESASTTETV